MSPLFCDVTPWYPWFDIALLRRVSFLNPLPYTRKPLSRGTLSSSPHRPNTQSQKPGAMVDSSTEMKGGIGTRARGKGWGGLDVMHEDWIRICDECDTLI